MSPGSYLWPGPAGGIAEYALSCDRDRAERLLIIPALFDEGHRLRRLAVDVMRRLDEAGIDCLLPDLPGTNESQVELASLALDDWRSAITSAAAQFRASHVLALRGGGLVMQSDLPGWLYGPLRGASLLRTLIRARILSSRETGIAEDSAALLSAARDGGIELAGYRLGAGMVRQLETAEPCGSLDVIEQAAIGGSPLWLRAEPSADEAQADALAAYLVRAIGG